VQYWPVVLPSSRTTLPDSHAFFYTSALATAVDHDYSITDGMTGKAVTARRAWEISDQIVYNQQMAGANVASCSAANRTVLNCDDPRWGIRPRPLIRNVRVVPSGTSAKLYYTAPDGNACKVAVSTSAFTSSDDSSDTTDAQANPGRTFTVTALSGGTPYNYRITCGSLGGAARVAGFFTTK
jgi:hypothetical protein